MRFDSSQPFTHADAVAAGISPSRLRTRAYRRLFHGVYVDSSAVTTAHLRARAALKLFPDGAWASHATAARIHDVPLPAIADEHVSVGEARHRRHHRGVRTHVCGSAEVMVVAGVRVSSACQMFVELAGLVGLVDLVVVGDHLVRRGTVTVEQLVAFCAGSRHRSARRARAAASYVRERVDSPMETRLRMLLVLAGLPEPRVNLEVRTGDGTLLRRYDLTYPEARAIVEYDGRQHIEREENWESDLDRREAIDDDEWRILVVTAKGIYRHPGRTVDRVHRLLRRRGMPGVPRRPDDQWRLHFPGWER